MGRPVRSEVELFNALAGAADQADLEDYRTRIRKCVLWLLGRRPSGELVVGDVPDMVDEVITRLETHLRPSSDETARRFTGSNEQFRRYLYRTVSSVYADTVNLRVRLRSLDAPIVTADGDERVLGDLLDDLVEWPTAGEGLGRPELDAGVQRALERVSERCRRWLLAFHRDGTLIKEIARQDGVRVNSVEVGLTRCRGYFRLAFLDAFLAGGDARFRERVSEGSRRLAGLHAAVFQAYWTDSRCVTEIATRLGLERDKVKTLLAEAKEQLWRALPEGGLS